jgi:ketol-acid reductoisomerase
MRYSVSDTAEFGDYTSGPRVIDERVRATMRQILGEVRDGTFAEKWISEYRRGAPSLYAARAREQAQPIEEVGRKLRALMPWLPKRDIPATSAPRPVVARELAPSGAD